MNETLNSSGFGWRHWMMNREEREARRIRRLMLCASLDKGDMESAQAIARIIENDSQTQAELEKLHLINLYYKQVSRKVVLELLKMDPFEYRRIATKYKVIGSQFYYCNQMVGTVYQFAHYWGVTRQQARNRLIKEGEKLDRNFQTTSTLYQQINN